MVKVKSGGKKVKKQKENECATSEMAGGWRREGERERKLGVNIDFG